MKISREWLAAESRRVQRSMDVNDFESGELQLPFLLKPICDRCTHSFEPSELVLYRHRSVCIKCQGKMLDEELEGYDERSARHQEPAGPLDGAEPWAGW